MPVLMVVLEEGHRLCCSFHAIASVTLDAAAQSEAPALSLIREAGRQVSGVFLGKMVNQGTRERICLPCERHQGL